MMKTKAKSQLRFLSAMIAVFLMALIPVLTSCGSDDEADTDINSARQHLRQQWHSQGMGLPSHIKEMIVDLSQNGQMKVFVKYVDQLREQLGLDDVWYEGVTANYSMQETTSINGLSALLSMANVQSQQFLNISARKCVWYHFDFSRNGWVESPFEASNITVNAHQLPSHELISSLVGQWHLGGNDFWQVVSAYGDYLVVNILPFAIDSSDGVARYKGGQTTFGAQKINGNTFIMSSFVGNVNMAFSMSSPLTGTVMQVDDISSFDTEHNMYPVLYTITKQTSPITNIQ